MHIGQEKYKIKVSAPEPRKRNNEYLTTKTNNKYLKPNTLI
jgi:hypothetical protein